MFPVRENLARSLRLALAEIALLLPPLQPRLRGFVEIRIRWSEVFSGNGVQGPQPMPTALSHFLENKWDYGFAHSDDSLISRMHRRLRGGRQMACLLAPLRG